MKRPPVLPSNLGPLVAELARINCALWHEEDKARSTDDAQVAAAKRTIDRLNQQRNDTIERIDALVLETVAPKLAQEDDGRDDR
jgi:hypothetical protein